MLGTAALTQEYFLDECKYVFKFLSPYITPPSLQKTQDQSSGLFNSDKRTGIIRRIERSSSASRRTQWNNSLLNIQYFFM
jgi:hypothetical protein